MTQYFSGDTVTRRESLKDWIIVRSASSIPLVAGLPHTSIDHTMPEWSADRPFTSSESVRSMSAPHTATRFEGEDFSYRTPFEVVRMKSICQIDSEGMEMSNTRRAALIAGQKNPFDYEAGKLGTKVLNRIDNVAHFGQGSPETSGKTGGADTRRVAGMVTHMAWTGLERCHGTQTEIDDFYGTQIPGDMFSVCYDVNHTQTLNSSIFFNQVIARAQNAGSNFEGAPWIFHVGIKAMHPVARFLIAEGGTPINDRNVDASAGMGYDYMTSMKLPSGVVVNFVANRWLDDSASTYTADNRDFTPGTPAPEGTINRTLSGDQIMFGHEPGTVRLGWYREPAFRKVETGGDYSRVAMVAEWTLLVDHPLCVIGAVNILQ